MVQPSDRGAVETVLSDDHEALFRYAQWHIGDYITGTIGMGLEQEGAYIRFLVRLYQRGKPLPDDDRYMAVLMNISVRVWKRLRETLVSVGKIIARDGCLTNARFEKERRRRADEMRKMASAARTRWSERRSQKSGLAEVSLKFGANLDETSGKLPENFPENHNEINGLEIRPHMLTNNQYPITNKEKEKIGGLGGACGARRVDVTEGAIRLSFDGRQFEFTCETIDYWAQVNLCPTATARQIVEAEARGWIADGQIPNAPSRWLQSQIARWRFRQQIGETQAADAIASGRASAPANRATPRHWRDVEREEAEETRRVLAEMKAEYQAEQAELANG